MATTKATELGQFGSKLTVHNENITLDGTVHGQYAGFDSDINTSSIGDLSDVDITTSAPSNNQSLIWDNANSKFVPGDSFSQSDFNTAFGNKSTNDLSEGSSNLYFTNARADARVALIVDAAPSTLDTLNELAAALGDDANFSTTVTNSIATKLPLAGGTITGDVSFTNGNKAVFGGTGNGELEIYAHATNNNVYISENGGSGNLNLGADNFNIYTNAFTKQVASFTAGSAKLLNDGNEKLATTATGIDVTGNATFADNGKAIFGAGSDLEVYHDGTNSRIAHTGTGHLVLSADNFRLRNNALSQDLMQVNASGNILLYHNGALKFATTATGIDVTGTTTTDQYLYVNSPNGTQLQLRSEDAYTTLAAGNRNLNISANRTIFLDDAFAEVMRINDNGNVGIGTSSPDAILDIEGNFETNYALKFTNTQGTGKVGGLRSHGTNGNDLTIYQDGARKQGWSSSEVKFYGTSNAEIMRIENGGNVGIGTATPALQSGGTGLHIHGSSASEIKLTNTTSGTGALNGVAFVTDGNSFTLNNRSPGAIQLRTNNTLALTITAAQLADFSGDIKLTDSKIAYFGVGNDLQIHSDGTNSFIKSPTGDLSIRSSDLLLQNANGTKYFEGKVDATHGTHVNLYQGGGIKLQTVSGGVYVSGNVALSGTVDGRDVAADGTKLDGIETAATADQTKSDIEGLGIDVPAANLTGTIAAARLSTATTQAESDDSTKIATTAYVVDKITTLIGGAPSTLNDLNELAAAINDDANYNTTLTTALGTKLPLAGGTMTGNVTFGDNNKAIFGAGSDLKIYHDGSNSYIRDEGVGGLFLQGSNSIVLEAPTGGNMLYAQDGGPVVLYYNASIRLSTTPGGVNVDGIVTVTGTVDGRDVAADGTKLDGIESGATADQTAAQILIAVKTVDGSGSGLDADTVDGVQASSFLRSDADDTMNGKLTIADDHIVLKQDTAATDGTGDIQRQAIGWHTAGSAGVLGAYITSTAQGSWGGDLRFNTRGSGGGSSVNRMIIGHDGNVGIGTTGPNESLHIYRASGDASFRLQSSSQQMRMDQNSIRTTTNTDFSVFTNSNSAQLYLKQSNGNVGIGTSSPGAHLHVYTSSSATAVIRIGSASAEAGINFDEGTTNKFQFRYRPSSDRFDVYNTTLGSNVMSFKDSNGYVGIGTTSPSEKLHVSGNILATGNITANSDISLKDNITPIPNALDKVLQIRGVTFNRNDIEDNPRHAGVIAQEVEKVLPEVVSEGEDGIKSVAYGNMVGLLIEAIKEQQEQIDKLKEKLESK